jgi:hypothetical protein
MAHKKAHKGAVQHDKVSGSCPDQQVMYGSCPNSIKNAGAIKKCPGKSQFSISTAGVWEKTLFPLYVSHKNEASDK